MLSYKLSRRELVQLTVYDVLGRQVMEAAYQQRPAGSHAFVFDVGTLPPGVYFARVETEDEADTHRMVHIK
jgi:hypothetical protein